MGLVGCSQVVARYCSSQSCFCCGEPPDSASQACHRCSRQQASMSAKVGSTLCLYQGRCRCATSAEAPDWLCHSSTTAPTNQASGCARCTARSLHTIGSCKPCSCLLSQ